MDSPHKGPVTRRVFPIDDVIMHLFSAKSFSEPMMSSCQMDLLEQTSVKFFETNFSEIWIKAQTFCFSLKTIANENVVCLMQAIMFIVLRNIITVNKAICLIWLIKFDGIWHSLQQDH